MSDDALTSGKDIPEKCSISLKVSSTNPLDSRVTAKRIAAKIGALARAISQCAEVVENESARKTGRHCRDISTLSDLFLEKLEFTSFGATFAIGVPENDLFAKEKIFHIRNMAREIVSSLRDNTFSKTILHFAQGFDFSALASPFTELLPNKEENIEVEVTVDGDIYKLDQKLSEKLEQDELVKAIRKRSVAALVFATINKDEHGNVLGVRKDTIKVLSELEEDGEEQIETKIIHATEAKSDCAAIEFKRPLLLTILKYKEHFEATQPELCLMAVGDTEEEARDLLLETIVDSYIYYDSLTAKQLESSGRKLKGKLKKLVKQCKRFQ